MADTEYATLTFALPEDQDSDKVQLWDCDTEDGAYAQVGSDLAYEYGDTSLEVTDIDVAKWYKIRFRNDVDSKVGPFSDPVNGADFDKAKPFLAVSTTSDGAHYATTAQVYDYTHNSLTTAIAASARVSEALRRARAIVDLRTADMDLDRFTDSFDTEIARRKYNAALRIVREAEINFALGTIYRGLADKHLMDGITGDQKQSSVSIGSSSMTEDSTLVGGEAAALLSALADRYSSVGAALLSSLYPPTIVITYGDISTRIPKFSVSNTFPWWSTR